MRHDSTWSSHTNFISLLILYEVIMSLTLSTPPLLPLFASEKNEKETGDGSFLFSGNRSHSSQRRDAFQQLLSVRRRQLPFPSFPSLLQTLPNLARSLIRMRLNCTAKFIIRTEKEKDKTRWLFSVSMFSGHLPVQSPPVKGDHSVR